MRKGGREECASAASRVGTTKEGWVRSGKWGFATQHTGDEVGWHIFLIV